MTKKKSGVFNGSWMDESVDLQMLEACIRNEPGELQSAPIIQEVAVQLGIWRLTELRRATEPDPAHWASLILDIAVPLKPDPLEVIELRQRVRRLPLLVKGVLNTHIFLQRDIGWLALLEAPSTEDLALFSQSMREIGESARHLRGRPGPKWDCGAALTAVTAAIVEHSNLSQAKARTLAAVLLKENGMRVPLEKSQLIEKTKK